MDVFGGVLAEECGRRLKEFFAFLILLETGRIRAAEPDPASPNGWRVNTWVKKGVLLGFRMGEIRDMSVGPLTFRDNS